MNRKNKLCIQYIHIYIKERKDKTVYMFYTFVENEVIYIN